MKNKIFSFLLAMLLFMSPFSITIFAKDSKAKATFNAVKLTNNGSDNNKLVFVIMGDGYTANQLPKFKKDANKLINGILNQEPFKTHKKDINFYIINVISNVSGASPNRDKIIDNYFGSCFNLAYNINQLLGPTKLNKAYSCLKNSKINYDKGIIVVNSDTYGGSGGDICVSSTNENSIEILLHELGHSLGGLGDEYFAGAVYTHEAANVTRQNNPTLVKWKSFVNKNNVGVYAIGGTTGWYIPHQNCKMKALNNPFCDVCKDVLDKKITSIISLKQKKYLKN